MQISKKLLATGVVLSAVGATTFGTVAAANAATSAPAPAAAPALAGDVHDTTTGSDVDFPDGVAVSLGEDGGMSLRPLTEDEKNGTDWKPVDE